MINELSLYLDTHSIKKYKFFKNVSQCFNNFLIIRVKMYEIKTIIYFDGYLLSLETSEIFPFDIIFTSNLINHLTMAQNL